MEITCVNYNSSVDIGNLLCLSGSVSLKTEIQNLPCRFIVRIKITSLTCLTCSPINGPYIVIIKHNSVFSYSFADCKIHESRPSRD